MISINTSLLCGPFSCIFARHFSQTFRAMAPVPKKYDYLVLGAGSGGIASVRRAAEFGVKGAVIEKGALGGTCVSTSTLLFVLI